MTLRGFIFLYLLVVPHALLLVVLVALLRRQLYRQFPVFLTYVIEELVQAAVMIPLVIASSTVGKRLAVPYSVFLAITTALRFGVIYEIFTYIFRDRIALKDFGKPLFRFVSVGLLAVALIFTAYAGTNTHESMFIVYLFDRAASILQSGLLVSLFMFSAQIGLSWRSQAFGIALGIGIVAAVNLAASAIWYETGYAHSVAVNYFVMGTYHACVLIWIFYLFAPERSYAPAALPQHDLETWNLELERLLKQ